MLHHTCLCFRIPRLIAAVIISPISHLFDYSLVSPLVAGIFDAWIELSARYLSFALFGHMVIRGRDSRKSYFIYRFQSVSVNLSAD